MKLAEREVPDIDHKKLEQAIGNETYRKQMEQDKGIAVQSVPTLFINGKPVPDSIDCDAIKQIIEEELKNGK